MSKTLSTLVATATLGAGLVHLAVGAGAPLPLLVLFVSAGLTHMGWAIAILIADRVPAPRFFVAVALGPIGVWATTVALGAAYTLPPGPLAAASLLGFASAAVVVIGLRRSRRPEQVASSPRAPSGGVPAGAGSQTSAGIPAEHPWRFIGTLAASAAIVAGIVTPALSGTWAGRFAEPHGSHEIPGFEVDEHAGH